MYHVLHPSSASNISPIFFNTPSFRHATTDSMQDFPQLLGQHSRLLIQIASSLQGAPHDPTVTGGQTLVAVRIDNKKSTCKIKGLFFSK